MQAGVGSSRHPDPAVAGREAAQTALAAAGVDRPDLVLLFATEGGDPAALAAAVRETTARAPLVGCSGEGVIHREHLIERPPAVVVLALRTPGARWVSGLAEGLAADSAGVGARIASAIRPHSGDDARALFLFPDGITVNFDRLLSGIEAGLAPARPLPVLGGAAGDALAFRQTWQVADDRVTRDGVAFAWLAGDVHPHWAVSHACVSLGIEYRVTRAEGNLLHALDGRPVLDVLREYLVDKELEDWVQAVTSFSFGLRAAGPGAGDDDLIIRAMVGGLDPATGAVRVPAEIPEGSVVCITRRDQRKLRDSVSRAVARLQAELGGARPGCVLQFDCAGRGQSFLRPSVQRQAQRELLRATDPDVPWAGLYTYGEIAPVDGRNTLHTYTVVLVALT